MYEIFFVILRGFWFLCAMCAMRAMRMQTCEEMQVSNNKSLRIYGTATTAKLCTFT